MMGKLARGEGRGPRVVRESHRARAGIFSSYALPGCFLTLLVLIVTVPVSSGAAPALAEPQRVVEKVSDGLRRILRKDRHLLQNDPAYVHRLVDELFMPNVDFRRVLSLVLGPYWRPATEEQRTAFGREFKNLLIHTYATAVNELSEWEIRYLPLQLDPAQTEVVVQTEVLRPGGEPVAVDYRMYKQGGRWLAYDVSVAGVSLLSNYRSTFVRLARKKGVDGLIADLAQRNAMRGRSN